MQSNLCFKNIVRCKVLSECWSAQCEVLLKLRARTTLTLFSCTDDATTYFFFADARSDWHRPSAIRLDALVFSQLGKEHSKQRAILDAGRSNRLSRAAPACLFALTSFSTLVTSPFVDDVQSAFMAFRMRIPFVSARMRSLWVGLL